ncbi:hypothetical protein PUR61_36475 [Streptomyces sp. BE20]|nr:hypothetical protein [Streptomyces sp. BE20]MEE1827636.1 hypothetical protein [Streptomyces sp. BE20]
MPKIPKADAWASAAGNAVRALPMEHDHVVQTPVIDRAKAR